MGRMLVYIFDLKITLFQNVHGIYFLIYTSLNNVFMIYIKQIY